MKGKEVGGRIMVHQRNQIEIGNSKMKLKIRSKVRHFTHDTESAFDLRIVYICI